MEPGSRNVVIVTASAREDGRLKVLGGGEAPIAGIEKGELVSVADFAESVCEAAAKAERSSGIAIGRLYYNFDEARIESAWLTGSRLLDGEGDVQTADVRAAVSAAERLVGNFEKKIVYSAETEYMIDEKDAVADPVGVFGHRLDVTVHFLLARADRWDLWSRLFRRAGIRRATPVLSGLSSAYGVLTAQERQAKKIIWDLGADYLNGLLMDRGRIREYRTLLSDNDGWDALSGVVLAVCQDFQKKNPGVSEVVLTGDCANDAKLFGELKDSLDVPVRRAAPQGIEKLIEMRHASAAGLLRLASEMEGRSFVNRPEKSVLSGTREKVKTFLSEYF